MITEKEPNRENVIAFIHNTETGKDRSISASRSLFLRILKFIRRIFR